MSGRIRTSVHGRIVRLIVACAIGGGLTAGCAGSKPSDGSGAQQVPSTVIHAGNGRGCLIGVSLFNYTDLMDWEEPALTAALNKAGANFQERDAKAFPDTQGPDIDGLIAAGAKVIVIEPAPEDEIGPALQRAANAGIPVVTLRRLNHTKALYVAFDPVEQGRQLARALLTVKPKGDYAIVKGDARAPESEAIASGVREILRPAVDRGDIKIVATVDTPQGDSAMAQQQIVGILSQNGGKLDAVAVADADEIAIGVERTLEQAGLKGRVAVGGVSDRWGASLGLSAIVRGELAADAWGNPERLGEAEAQAAMALCRDPDITKVPGSASVTWPGRDPMQAILLAPVAITRDNLDVAVNTSIEWRKRICGYDSVPAPDWAPACQGWTPQP